MIRILTYNEIKEIEAKADKSGISYLRLMENAGSAAAKEIRNRFDETNKRNVAVICGKGKNGGDGFVIARKLFENGYNVTVFLAMGVPTAQTSIEMFENVRAMNINIEMIDEDRLKLKFKLSKFDIIIDAIFGTGFVGETDIKLSGIIDVINQSTAYVVSIDLPSGMYTDTSVLSNAIVRPDLTITVIALKSSLVLSPTAQMAGEKVVISIGISEEILNSYNSIYSLNLEDIKKNFIKRNENSNKGDYGTGLIIGGSYEMPGAALLSTSSAIECGIGLVKSAFPDMAYSAISSSINEKVLIPLSSNRFGRISALSSKRILDEINISDATLIGVGMGNDYDTKEIVKIVCENIKNPIIIDADGLNVLSDDINIINRIDALKIITPHPGEAARLLKCTVADVQNDRIAAAKKLYELTGAVVVLKGSGTVITANGEDFYINRNGNSGMATAGSGDTLSGMMLAFLSGGMSAFSAAVSAVYIHGMAGDKVAKNNSKMATTPTKIIAELQNVLLNFEEK
ncbi:MAG: NAD(P)H-hydrate dehydratase [Oscillospiraceae bacterium]